MKKITLIAALLGSAYFAHAQVGIGTPTPSASSMLDITSGNKGVLIPRVALENTTKVLTTGVDQVESLLVYNTAERDDVTPGFYYWYSNKWERIINQTDLTNAIENANSELEDIINLLQIAYPSNNLDGSTTSGPALGGGMVYTPAVGTEGAVGYVPAKIEYVYYDGTTYVKQDLTDMLSDIIDPANGSVFYNNIGTDVAPVFAFQYWDSSLNNGEGGFTTITISDLVQANETKTKFVTIDNKQYYVSESYAGSGDPVLGTEAGVYLIDVVGGVVNNIEEIFTTSTTIVINEGGTNQQTFTTVQEYIEYIISESDLQEGVMTFVPGTGTTTAEQLASSSFAYTLADGTQSAPVTFSSIVKANQSLTDIATSNIANVINYVYTAEPALDGTARIYTIDLTSDLINQITNNEDVRNAITNIGNGGIFYNGTGGALMVGNVSIPAGSLYTKDTSGNGVLIDLGSIIVSEVVENFNTIVNSPVTVNGNAYNTVEEYIQYISESNGANVGYTTAEILAADNPGGLPIPANSIYYVNDNGVKVIIPLGDIVYQGITQFTETQVTDVKTKLGDKIVLGTSIITGDTYNGKAVRKGIFETTVTANAATTSGVTLDVAAGEIISITVKYAGGLVANVTDLVVLNSAVTFNIGTGNMYQVLGTSLITAQVIVEFAVQ